MELDLTTKNNVFNAVGSQGQWFQHRWGKRSYPNLELDFDDVKKIVSKLGKDESVYAKSVYGDSMQWENIADLAKLLGEKLIITTYGMAGEDQIEAINKTGAFVHVMLDGIDDLCGKVFLRAKWSKIDKFIETCNNRLIEFYVYEHNKHQIPDLIKYCHNKDIFLKLSPGTAKDAVGSAIIDQMGEWLYDVMPEAVNTDFKGPGYWTAELEDYENIKAIELQRNTENHTSLRTFMTSPEGRSVLEKPLVSSFIPNEDYFDDFADEYKEETSDNCYIAVSGHVFKNHEEYTMFSQMLSPDWDVSTETCKTDAVTHNLFAQKVLWYAKRFDEKYINEIEIDKVFS
jgi:hypothetical protein